MYASIFKGCEHSDTQHYTFIEVKKKSCLHLIYIYIYICVCVCMSVSVSTYACSDLAGSLGSGLMMLWKSPAVIVAPSRGNGAGPTFKALLPPVFVGTWPAWMHVYLFTHASICLTGCYKRKNCTLTMVSCAWVTSVRLLVGCCSSGSEVRETVVSVKWLRNKNV